MDAYFIVDDWCDSLNREGFAVFYGDPFTATGTLAREFRRLGEAVAYVSKHTDTTHPPHERGYRVRLARRHGSHSVTVILGWDHFPFREHDLWQARGFDAHGLHFNRAFRSKRACEKFLTAMRRGDNVERY